MRVELCIGDMTSSTGMGLLPAGQGDTPGPQPVSEVATGLLQFAELFTASTAGTFNVHEPGCRLGRWNKHLFMGVCFVRSLLLWSRSIFEPQQPEHRSWECLPYAISQPDVVPMSSACLI